jgi:nucleotide-binding universal stress UspA family protein
MFNRILMAYDGTAEGRVALLAFAHIASFVDCQAHLLAVASMPSTMFLSEGFIPEELIDTEKNRMQSILDEGVASLEKMGFWVTGHLAMGEPVEEISTLARQLNCDLIVVGHKQSASWTKRWWQGSISKSLIEMAPCSVLVTNTH